MKILFLGKTFVIPKKKFNKWHLKEFSCLVVLKKKSHFAEACGEFIFISKNYGSVWQIK
jgi:hypothetical protein